MAGLSTLLPAHGSRRGISHEVSANCKRASVCVPGTSLFSTDHAKANGNVELCPIILLDDRKRCCFQLSRSTGIDFRSSLQELKETCCLKTNCYVHMIRTNVDTAVYFCSRLPDVHRRDNCGKRKVSCSLYIVRPPCTRNPLE